MSSLIQCFAAIAGSIREKTKMAITRPPLNGNGYVSGVRFWAQEHTYWLKKVLPAYCYFKEAIELIKDAVLIGTI